MAGEIVVDAAGVGLGDALAASGGTLVDMWARTEKTSPRNPERAHSVTWAKIGL